MRQWNPVKYMLGVEAGGRMRRAEWVALGYFVFGAIEGLILGGILYLAITWPSVN